MYETLWLGIREIITTMLWLAVFFTPPTWVLWRMTWESRKYDEEAKIPFTQFPLRPPGESCRVRAEEMFEKGVENLFILIVGCGIFGLTTVQTKSEHKLTIAGMAGVIVLGITAYTAPRIFRSMKECWRYRLGFKGERLVGQELDQLLAKGYRVFHDVPFDGYNIDHIAVGPPGVFVVETKARRKWKVKELKHPAYMVRYDGSTLTWPSGRSDRFGLEQTERNARTVSEWLTAATGESVVCYPILTLPGWWVERRIV